MKRCPKCSMEINARTLMCPSCGFNPGLNNQLNLSYEIGDRVLLGALCLTIGLIAWGMCIYFWGLPGTLFSHIGFELMFTLLSLAVLGLTWAVFTPEFIKKILFDHAMKTLMVYTVLLLVTMGLFVLQFWHK